MVRGLASRAVRETRRTPTLTHLHAMLRLSPHRPLLPALAATLLAAAGTPLTAQRPAADSSTSTPVSDMRYEVTVDAAALATRRLRVATSFTVSGTSPVVLSLPAWTP